MLDLKGFTGFSVHFECWNAFNASNGQSSKLWKKS